MHRSVWLFRRSAGLRRAVTFVFDQPAHFVFSHELRFSLRELKGLSQKGEIIAIIPLPSCTGVRGNSLRRSRGMRRKEKEKEGMKIEELAEEQRCAKRCTAQHADEGRGSC